MIYIFSFIIGLICGSVLTFFKTRDKLVRIYSQELDKLKNQTENLYQEKLKQELLLMPVPSNVKPTSGRLNQINGISKKFHI